MRVLRQIYRLRLTNAQLNNILVPAGIPRPEPPRPVGQPLIPGSRTAPSLPEAAPPYPGSMLPGIDAGTARVPNAASSPALPDQADALCTIPGAAGPITGLEGPVPAIRPARGTRCTGLPRGAGFVSRAPEGQPVRHPSPDCRPIRDSRDYQETRWTRRCWLDIRILSDGERPRIVMAGGTAERSLVTPEGLGERLCCPATGRLTSGSRLSPRTKSVGKAQDCGRIRGLIRAARHPPKSSVP